MRISTDSRFQAGTSLLSSGGQGQRMVCPVTSSTESIIVRPRPSQEVMARSSTVPSTTRLLVTPQSQHQVRHGATPLLVTSASVEPLASLGK